MISKFSIFVVTLIFMMSCQKAEAPLNVQSAAPAAGLPSCEQALAELPTYNDSSDMFSLVYNSYQKHPTCMDFGFGKVKDLVIVSIDKKWGDLTNLDRLMKNDMGFKNFVLTSLRWEHTEFLGSLKAIAKKSEKDCPLKLNSLCLEIKNACATAIFNEEEHRLSLP